MDHSKLFKTPFADIYPYYIQKAEKKGRTKAEVDAIICWLTGHDQVGLQQQIEMRVSLQDFFEKAPFINPKVILITGMICGYRVENIEDPLMRKIRYLDKLVDELAKGKALKKILREL